MIQTIRQHDRNFDKKFQAILDRANDDTQAVSKIVDDILENIKIKGDTAIYEDISRFDNWECSTADELYVAKDSFKKCYENLDENLKNSLQVAHDRIKSYHEKQLQKSWLDFEPNGTITGVKISAVAKAGLYIPGGKAVYPSSLLMNAIAAKVAGVADITVATPTPYGKIDKLLLASCYLCGVDKVIKVGGASAIGAMAYGTPSIDKVDVITGPGNIFVATAKQKVYGSVNIDMIAGPSEIGILADSKADATYIAADMLSQAEHDEMASSILITTSETVAKDVATNIELQLENLSRKDIAKASIDSRGAIIVVDDMSVAVKLMDDIAPEHLEVLTINPFDMLPMIQNAGAIFLGENTPEPIGDYIAGPNHTLPTGGTARFFSPLGVENFIKKSSIISFSKQAIGELGVHAINIANQEGLTAHANSVKLRL